MPESNTATIKIRDLVYRYPDGTIALDGITLSIEPNESVCLAGPNGAGKSTLLQILAGLLRSDGDIHVSDQSGGSWSVGLVFQDPDDQLFCPTVEDDVAFGPRNQSLDQDEVALRVQSALSATGLEGFEDRSAHHLSGGEKKRAAIAAVLACQPNILALDEPWANLDARGSRSVSNIVRNFEGTRIITSQDLYRAREVCRRIIILDRGKLVADGNFDQILANRKLLETHGLDIHPCCPFCGR